MIIVDYSKEMQEYLDDIKVSTIEYKIIGSEIHIDLIQQQLWYRINAGYPHLTMKYAKEYAILMSKIFVKS